MNKTVTISLLVLSLIISNNSSSYANQIDSGELRSLSTSDFNFSTNSGGNMSVNWDYNDNIYQNESLRIGLQVYDTQTLANISSADVRLYLEFGFWNETSLSNYSVISGLDGSVTAIAIFELVLIKNSSIDISVIAYLAADGYISTNYTTKVSILKSQPIVFLEVANTENIIETGGNVTFFVFSRYGDYSLQNLSIFVNATDGVFSNNMSEITIVLDEYGQHNLGWKAPVIDQLVTEYYINVTFSVVDLLYTSNIVTTTIILSPNSMDDDGMEYIPETTTNVNLTIQGGLNNPVLVRTISAGIGLILGILFGYILYMRSSKKSRNEY